MSKESRIPKPVEKGVVRVPLVMQLEALECGAASLTMIMHYYHDVRVKTLGRKAPISQKP